MASLPRPLLAALVAVIAAFAVWTVALKPSSSSQPAPAAPAPSAPASPAKAPKASKASKATTPHAAVAKPNAVVHTAVSPLATLTAALGAHKVVALLFYNPAGADDQADRQALGTLSTHHGAVVKLAVPVDQLARFSAITNQVPVTTSPTLIVIDSHRRASTLVGFADPLEFNQLVSAALAAK
jgi:hypothetical protein